ncbi:MAG: hypothetical protein CTY18_03020 [Methylomonas sp.]|nr:MAG: hypothetical protein CTY18_03020 [Methylomonas sp.]
MSKLDWRKVRPLDLRDAMEWCTKYARAKHNYSVDNIADLMGVNKWTLYKWIADADMPARLIKPFEHVCGVNYVSKWLVESAGKMVVDIPKGKKCGVNDLQRLQASYHDSVGELIRFYDGGADVEKTLSAIQAALEQTAWHRSNVQKYRQPELPFED